MRALAGFASGIALPAGSKLLGVAPFPQGPILFNHDPSQVIGYADGERIFIRAADITLVGCVSFAEAVGSHQTQLLNRIRGCELK